MREKILTLPSSTCTNVHRSVLDKQNNEAGENHRPIQFKTNNILVTTIGIKKGSMGLKKMTKS